MTSMSTARPRARPGRRGPRTAAGKARSARNALKHGLRAAKYLVLPDEDAAEFAGLEAALIEELAPVGALQAMLARRVASAAWRLARADRIEANLFAERSYGADSNSGIALIGDDNGTRSFETLLRYRGAAMAEFCRALRTLKALQAEQAVAPGVALAARPTRSAPRRPLANGPRPSEPEQPARRLQSVMPEPPPPGSALHEPAAPWLPDKPETGGAHREAPAGRTNPRLQPPVGQTIVADGAQPTAAALLRCMPGVGL
jgi:hypothetical protein